jgi:PAS domain S-box-containing protein
MSERSTTQARVVHLEAVLQGMRAIARLLARERDPRALLREAAQALYETRGLEAIAIVETEGDEVVRSHVAGAPESCRALSRMLDGGEPPACVRRASRDGEVVIRHQAVSSCAGCPVACEWAPARDAVAVPIEHEGRRYGALLASLPMGGAADPDEIAMLRELAGDLALGLRNLELDRALREKERWYRLVSENVSDVIWVLDLETSRFTFVSPSVERLRGYTVAEVLVQSLADAVTPASAAYLGRVVPKRLAAFQHGANTRFVDEIEQPRKDGSTVWTETTTSFARDEVTGHAIVYGTSRDISERRAQRALQEQFARIAASAPGVIHTLHMRADGSLCMPFSTPAVEDLLGLSREELARTTEGLVALVHPDDHERIRERLAASARDRTPWHDEYRFFHPLKGLRWLAGWSSPKELPGGELEWCGFLMDVTARREAEEAVRASTERFRSLFENMVSGCAHCRLIYEGDQPVDWEYLAVNPAFERATGLRDVVGRRVSEVLPGFAQHGLGVLRDYAEVVRTGVAGRFEVDGRPPLGRWFATSAYRAAPGEFVTILDDITDRKNAELALRESEARFRAIFEGAGVGVAQLESASGRFVLVNDAYCGIVGYSREEMLGGTWQGITHPDDVGADAAGMARLVAGQAASYDLEKRYLRKDGATVWVHLTVSRMWGPGEAPTHHIAVVEDITARKQAEAALLEAQAELRALAADLERRVSDRTADLSRAAQAKDDFLASMSHELRTPLNGILGLTEALTEGVYGPLGEQPLNALGRVGESGRHLLALINDILDLAKVEAGKIDLDEGPVSIVDLCHASLRLVQEAARKKRLQATFKAQTGLPPMLVDERRLKQVLVNLLTNAVKFTPEGGKIGLEVTRVAAGPAVQIAVWDTGIGIAEEDLPRLFLPFVQLDSRLSRQHAGTGLGLALVRRMIELHGGEIRVESEPGRGSRFVVTLPERVAAAPSAPVPARLDPPAGIRPHGASGKVLVADDDETNLAVLRDLLSRQGYTVHEARDGRDAVAKARALHPDAVLMDVQMPIMDGLEAMRCIRASADIADVPMIAVTALAMQGDEARCRRAGADEYLSKPLALPRLLATLERLIAARRERRES